MKEGGGERMRKCRREEIARKRGEGENERGKGE